ncbi:MULTISPECIES: hypothetical protein [Kitasatospora]|uniref:Uncharacterized protein n=2 Tax=Kitasatospora TaxID=2063 RepID=A0ABT1IUZ7_9ACTN|nr:hypothetical protein [Kitasatospora paracochleata]MCP2308979.1 hypothetical protein [Kitasatospora paracochleata]
MPAEKPKPGNRRAHSAALRAEEARREKRRKLLTRGAIGLVILAAIGGIATVIVNNQGSSGTASGIPSQPRLTAEGRTTPPPWPVPSDPTAAVKAAGLPMLGAEGTALHIHAHLDVIADGKPVTVPALIGIDEVQQLVSPLHTHDETGIIHIESPKQADFSMGQFLTQWQVSASADHLGGLKTDDTHTLTAYVNGKAVSGNPAAILLNAHDEIALVYGTAAENASVTVPSSYNFPSGL